MAFDYHADSFGGPDGGAARLAGAFPVRQPRFGLPPIIGVMGVAIQTATESITMTNVTTTGTNAHIIPTFTSTIGGIPALCCDARTLHTYLGNARQFSDWFKQRRDQYGFKAGKDFELVSQNSETKKVGRGGDRRSQDYHLSLNMAKELSMVENNDQGRAARRYFIECERKALEAAGQLVAPAHTDTLIPSEQQNLQELVDAKCKGMADQGKARAEIWSRLHHKFRVAKYSQLPRTQLTEAQLYIMGMQLSTTAEAPAAPRPMAAEESLSSNDMNHIRRAIYHAVHGMRFGGVWTQAVWFYLRRALALPSPAQFSVSHLPRIGSEMQRIVSATEQVHDLIIHIEREAARRIFRKGESPAVVIPALESYASARLKKMETDMAELPTWVMQDILEITQRTPGGYHGHDNLAEQLDFFRSAAASHGA